jgi:hypothetical protein
MGVGFGRRPFCSLKRISEEARPRGRWTPDCDPSNGNFIRVHELTSQARPCSGANHTKEKSHEKEYDRSGCPRGWPAPSPFDAGSAPDLKNAVSAIHSSEVTLVGHGGGGGGGGRGDGSGGGGRGGGGGGHIGNLLAAPTWDRLCGGYDPPAPIFP